MPGWRRWLPDAILLAALGLLPLLRFWPLFAPNPRDQMTLVEGDFNIEFFPQIHAISTIVRGGELPLWNPWSDAGQPLMADPQMAIWYPLNWVLPWLVRDIGASSLVALEAHTVLQLGLLALALAILAGHPQLLLFQLYGLALYGGYRLWELRRAPRAVVHATLLGAVMGIVGLSVAAIQLVPSLEFLQLSDRATSSYQFTADGFSPFELVLDSLAPRILGGVPLYVGILPLLLAATAVGGVRHRLVPYFALLGALGLVVSLGGHSFVHSVLYLFAPGCALLQQQ